MNNLQRSQSMKVFHIEQFKCTLCQNWFCPPYNLPYLLPCTHSVCAYCIQKSKQSGSSKILCPVDREISIISQARINQITKKALQRLMKQHNSFNQHTQLDRIKSLSLSFDQILSKNNRQIDNLSKLIDQIFAGEIKRIQKIWDRVKTEIHRPQKLIQNWKVQVKTYLTNIKKNYGGLQQLQGDGKLLQPLTNYIEQGRKIKMQLNEFFSNDFNTVAQEIVSCPTICFDKRFTIANLIIGSISGHSDNLIDCIQGMQKVKNTQAFTKGNMKSNFFDANRKFNITQNIKSENQENSIDFQLSQRQPKTSNQSERFNELIRKPNNMINQERNFNNSNGSIKGTPITNIIGVTRTSSQFDKQPNRQQNFLRSQYQIPPVQEQLGSLSIVSPDSSFHPNQTQKSRMSKNTKSSKKSLNSGKANISNKPAKNQSIQISMNNRYEEASHSFPQYQEHSKIQIKPNYTDESLNSHLDAINFKNNMVQPLPLKSNSFHNVKSNLSQQENKANSSFGNNKNHNQNLNTSEKNFTFMKNHSSNPNQNKDLSPLYKIPLTEKENNLRFISSPAVARQLFIMEGPQHEVAEEMLLSEGRQAGNWELGRVNFLKQWQIKRNQPKEDVQVKQRGSFNCEKQKLTYMRRIQHAKAEQAANQTQIRQNCIQLVSYSLQDIDMSLYLSHFDWNDIQVVKLVKVCLQDEQLNPLLNFILNSKVHTLVLSSNALTQVSIDALLYFFELNSCLKSVYLGTNSINTLKTNTKTKINILKQKGINIYI